MRWRFWQTKSKYYIPIVWLNKEPDGIQKAIYRLRNLEWRVRGKKLRPKPPAR